MQKIIIILFLLFGPGKTNTHNKFILVIDAGHGGKDSGAIGYQGIKEKNITLNIAKAIELLIKEYDNEISVYLTRYKDTYLTLGQRTKIVKGIKADLFISIHCDANKSKYSNGTTIYVQKNLKSRNYNIENYKKSVKYALIQNKIFNKDLGLNTHKIMFNNYQVLREGLQYCPSVLIETGYITNKKDAEYYKKTGQKALSYAILKAILEYKNSLKYGRNNK